MGVTPPVEELPGIQLIHDQGHAVGPGQRCDLPDLPVRVNRAGWIVGVGEQKQLHTAAKRLLQLPQIQA